MKKVLEIEISLTDCVKYEICVPTDLHNYLLSTIMAKQV